MATPFINIYKKTELVKDDNRIVGKPTNQIYELYYEYMSYAIGVFFRDCYKDLESHTPFSQKEFAFVSDGTSVEFQLSEQPLTDGLFYVGYSNGVDLNFTEITSMNYTYDSLNNKIVINDIIIPKDYVVYVSSYIIGQFEANLAYDEIRILCEAIMIPYLEEQVNRNSLLTQMVYGAGQSMYAQSTHNN